LIDAIFPVGKLLEYLAMQKTSLRNIIDMLPPYFTAQRRVACPWEQKGTVMRLLNEQYKERIVEQVDGLKIQLDGADWVLIVPEADEAVFTIFAEGSSVDVAAALADRYARVIEGMRS
jgi:mannose-1-phosphate guanylyltransferase / phosphomannomutase